MDHRERFGRPAPQLLEISMARTGKDRNLGENLIRRCHRFARTGKELGQGHLPLTGRAPKGELGTQHQQSR